MTSLRDKNSIFLIVCLHIYGVTLMISHEEMQSHKASVILTLPTRFHLDQSVLKMRSYGNKEIKEITEVLNIPDTDFLSLFLSSNYKFKLLTLSSKLYIQNNTGSAHLFQRIRKYNLHYHKVRGDILGQPCMHLTPTEVKIKTF